ncbi:DUF4177 domain-containing protein [Antarcticimicrobium sediminis]|uniref:DUF4177 domain-containing protein n=1 Tax=Antarcticimicrobium sediminis TaxID=2546227 RepID=UPI001FDEBA54|nr:DUF4177 domain-containing protein [Antarcticimicrobium sediminis]
MPRYEYKVIPAPAKGRKAKGVRTPEARFSLAIETTLNDMGADGWEYLRAELLPSDERSGLTGSTVNWRNVLVFRRLKDGASEAFQPRLMEAPDLTAPDPVAPDPITPDLKTLAAAGIAAAADPAFPTPDPTALDRTALAPPEPGAPAIWPVTPGEPPLHAETDMDETEDNGVEDNGVEDTAEGAGLGAALKARARKARAAFDASADKPGSATDDKTENSDDTDAGSGRA